MPACDALRANLPFCIVPLVLLVERCGYAHAIITIIVGGREQEVPILLKYLFSSEGLKRVFCVVFISIFARKIVTNGNG